MLGTRRVVVAIIFGLLQCLSVNPVAADIKEIRVKPLLTLDSTDALHRSKQHIIYKQARPEYAALARHLALLALVTGDREFAAFYGELTQIEKNNSQEQHLLVEQVVKEIGRFWQQRKVALKGGFAQFAPDEAIFESPKGQSLSQLVLSVEPQGNDFLAVVSHIQQLLWLDSKAPWPEIRLNRLLRVGDKSERLQEIVKRLALLGDLVIQGSDDVYSSWMELGVKQFQRRHGLKTDGVIGPKTMAWLNLSPYERARLLATNFVEKLSFQHQLPDRYLLVNIPAFELLLIDKGLEVLRSRVIVGKPSRKTPLLSSEISNVVINPSWRVPRKLIYRDLLPHVRKDGSYIDKRQFDVFDARGNKLEHTPEQWQELARGRFPYRMVQKPGDINALGRFKFHFANRYSVYLHDTPDKALFDESNRALSSGCIRVESVTALANWMAANLIKDKQTWVEYQSNNSETRWFAFRQTLPVHLVYWTAWIDKRNLPQFRDDIYNFGQKVHLAENN